MINVVLLFRNGNLDTKRASFPVLPSKGDIIWPDELFNENENFSEGDEWVVVEIQWHIDINGVALPRIILTSE